MKVLVSTTRWRAFDSLHLRCRSPRWPGANRVVKPRQSSVVSIESRTRVTSAASTQRRGVRCRQILTDQLRLGLVLGAACRLGSSSRCG
jgi:hypothetical protein